MMILFSSFTRRTRENVFPVERHPVVCMLDFPFPLPGYAPIDSFLCKRLQGWTHGQASYLLALLNRTGTLSPWAGSFYLSHLFVQQYHLSSIRQLKKPLRFLFSRALIAQRRNGLQVASISTGSGEFRICTQSTRSQERTGIQVTPNVS